MNSQEAPLRFTPLLVLLIMTSAACNTSSGGAPNPEDPTPSSEVSGDVSVDAPTDLPEVSDSDAPASDASASGERSERERRAKRAASERAASEASAKRCCGPPVVERAQKRCCGYHGA